MRRPQWLPTRAQLPGIALAGALGSLALVVTSQLPASPLLSDILVALLLGVLVLNTPLRRPLGLALPSAEREPDRYAPGLRFTGKWLLRLGIILMGLKVQTRFFGERELYVIAAIASISVPSTFFTTHCFGALLGLRRPMTDLVAGGTMICGASAINAIAPVTRAHREEQGIALAVAFLYSVVALLVFRTVAQLVGLTPVMAGLWSGLAVNDLSSAVAVGAQMGPSGGVVAAAAKSARILLMAPLLVALSLVRRDGTPTGAQQGGVKQGIIDTLPLFILGYVALAVARAAGDHLFGSAPVWARLLELDALAVDLLMLTVSAGIGLHLGLRALVTTSPRAIVVGGAASLWLAGTSLGMVVITSRESLAAAVVAGSAALAVSYGAYRIANAAERRLTTMRERFGRGAPLALAEATALLDAADREGRLDDALLRQLLLQLHPAIGELIPVRKSPLPKGEGCRWITYWEGRSGWALVAVCREPGSYTPIHAHPHRLLGKVIEGVLEEVRFAETDRGELAVAARDVLGHNQLVESDGPASVHLVRVIGDGPVIDLQLRGPETGAPGRRFRTDGPLPIDALRVGSRLRVTEEADDRPGHGGEGARAGEIAGITVTTSS